MDTIKLEKFQALKRYRRRERTLLKRLIQNSVLVFLLGSLLSSPLWLSYISSLLKSFLHLSPGQITAIFGTKFLFLAGNIIIIFLILDSKSSRCCWTRDHIYDEYIITKQSNLQRDQKESLLKKKIEQEKEEKEKDGGEVEGVGSGYEDMDVEEQEEEEEEEEEEELNELAKRSDDLIARVNQQWKLEAKMLSSYDKSVRRVQKLEEWIEAH